MKKNNEFEEVVSLIQESKKKAFQKVNEQLVLLYFNVGGIVSKKVASGIWGNSTIDQLAYYIQKYYKELQGFTRSALYRMKQFYEAYYSSEFLSAAKDQLYSPENQTKIVAAVPRQFKQNSNELSLMVLSLLTQISWTNHLLILAKTKTVEEKLFYLYTCITDKLASRELERQLNSAVFERTILASKAVSPGVTQLGQDLFKDPYIFEFLDLPEGHSEKDLEKSLILNLRKFILEIGKGFAYMGSKDYYSDLLF